MSDEASQSSHADAGPVQRPVVQPAPKRCECHACIAEHDLRGACGWPLGMTQMVLCPTCGNKRCPHATDHRNACTGSNDSGERVFLEEFRKTKKAILKIEARQNGIKSDCEAEDYAYSHPDYQALLTALEIATSTDEKLRLQILAAELRISTWQTKQADERAERRAYGA